MSQSFALWRKEEYAKKLEGKAASWDYLFYAEDEDGARGYLDSAREKRPEAKLEVRYWPSDLLVRERVVERSEV